MAGGDASPGAWPGPSTSSLLSAIASVCSPLPAIVAVRSSVSRGRGPVLHIARQAGVSRPAVWCWQQRYGEEGINGHTRWPGRAPLSTGTSPRCWRAPAPSRRARPPIGRAVQWPRPSAPRCAPSSVCGTPIASDRIGCGPSSGPTIRGSSRRSRTWSASIWTRRPMQWSSHRREEPDPGARSHPAGRSWPEAPASAARWSGQRTLANQTRQVRHHDLSGAERHDDLVRRARYPGRDRGRTLHAEAYP